MKKNSNKLIIIIYILLTFHYSFFYGQKDTIKNKTNAELYFGIAPSYYSKIQLNDYLEKNNINTLNQFAYPVLLGVNMNFNKFQINDEISISTNMNYKLTDSKTRLNILSNRIGASYNLVDNNDIKISFGISYVFSSYSALVYLKSKDLDLNKIDTASSKGMIQLTNFSHNIGALLSFVIKDNSKAKQTCVKIGYDYAMSVHKWQSEYMNVINSPNERFDRIYISLSRPIWLSK